MGTYTTNYNLFMPTVGEQGWGTLVNGNFSTIDSTMAGLNTRLTAVENEVNGALSCTSVTTSGTITSTGKITGNGGIGTTSLTTSSTITSTGLITANGGVKGNLTGNVTGNVTGKFTLTGTPSTSTPYSSANVVLFTIPSAEWRWSTGQNRPGATTETISAIPTSFTTPWGTYTINRTTLSIKFTVTKSNSSATITVTFDGTTVLSGSGTSFTVSYDTSKSHTITIASQQIGTYSTNAVKLYLK